MSQCLHIKIGTFQYTGSNGKDSQLLTQDLFTNKIHSI